MGLTAPRLPAVLLALLAPLAAAGQEASPGEAGAPVAAAGQEEVPEAPSALVEADLTVYAGTPGALRIDLVYRLRPAPGTRSVPVRALPLPGAHPLGPRASVWEDPVPLTLEPDSTGMLVGEVALPAPSRPGDVVVLRLRYRVPGLAAQGGGRPTRVPLLVVPWPPVEALPETFAARLELPAGVRLEGGFPATWTREPGLAGWQVRYRTELPVLPSLVSFRAATADGEPVSAGPREVTSASPGGDGAPRRGGFVLWGLFAVFGATLVLYVVWMAWVERREAGKGGAGSREAGA